MNAQKVNQRFIREDKNRGEGEKGRAKAGIRKVKKGEEEKDGNEGEITFSES